MEIAVPLEVPFSEEETETMVDGTAMFSVPGVELGIGVAPGPVWPGVGEA